MRSILRLGFLVLLIVVVGSARAEAGFWDWLEELNGPGPSTAGNVPIMISFFCKPFVGVDKDGKRDATKGPQNLVEAALRRSAVSELEQTKTCFYYDFHSFNAAADVHYYDVDSRLWEFGVTTKLHPTVEIGGGLGRFSFSSRLPDSAGGTELSDGRTAVTFPRVVFKPLLAMPWFKENPRALGLLQLYFKNTIIVGTLADEDFANKGNIDFVRTNQRVESVGFTIDLTVVGNILFDALKKN